MAKLRKASAIELTGVHKPSLWEKIRQSKVLILMCLPAIVFFFIFSYMPMPGAYIAFTSFQYNLGIWKSPFVGLQNFKFLFMSGQLTLLLQMARMAAGDAQFIVASHSPILLGMPDAGILSFDGGRIHACAWRDTDSYQITEMFINRREGLLEKLMAEEA